MFIAQHRPPTEDNLAIVSLCAFLLKTTSALSEFTLWLNASLHERHIDLQFEDGGAGPKRCLTER
jgi:hypothetical protein